MNRAIEILYSESNKQKNIYKYKIKMKVLCKSRVNILTIIDISNSIKKLKNG